MKNHCQLLLYPLIILAIMGTKTDYEILSNQELSLILDENQRDFESEDTILESGAFVYKLDSMIIIKSNDFRPNVKGILIHNKETYQEFIKNEKFPIELDINYSLWVAEANILESTKFNLTSYLEKLIHYTGDIDTSNMYVFLQKAHLKITKDKRCKEEIRTAYCLIFLDEISKTTSCQLNFVKKYAFFNYYFEPNLKNTGSGFIISADALLTSLSNKKLTFEFIYNYFKGQMSQR
ncbi:MAG: hypothetical protein ACK5Z2_14760 [Bacteroidota bacterium]|jgi:hypothetical protein